MLAELAQNAVTRTGLADTLGLLHAKGVLNDRVLQGCALSGSLFVIALDPFLRFASSLMEEHEHNIIRACANDIGAVLAHFTGLRQLSHLFHLLAMFTTCTWTHQNATSCSSRP